ncbi:hypothetical protein E9230_002478 [Corynebacterium glutamicum]|nr:hypothetical protein [Corynebacterium glutamicum]
MTSGDKKSVEWVMNLPFENRSEPIHVKSKCQIFAYYPIFINFHSLEFSHRYFQIRMSYFLIPHTG